MNRMSDIEDNSFLQRNGMPKKDRGSFANLVRRGYSFWIYLDL